MLVGNMTGVLVGLKNPSPAHSVLPPSSDVMGMCQLSPVFLTFTALLLAALLTILHSLSLPCRCLVPLVVSLSFLHAEVGDGFPGGDSPGAQHDPEQPGDGADGAADDAGPDRPPAGRSDGTRKPRGLSGSGNGGWFQPCHARVPTTAPLGCTISSYSYSCCSGDPSATTAR